MKTKKVNNVCFESFESVQEFVCTLSKAKNNRVFANKKDSESTSAYNEKWTGCKDFQSAQSLLKSGYKEGLKDLMQCKTPVNIQSPAKRKNTFSDVCGFAPIVPNAIIGIPQSMINQRVQTKQAKVINIYFDITADWTVKSETFITGGKNIFALVKSLELRGIRVNLNAFCPIHSGWRKNQFALLSVKIKDAKQAINPQLISYPIIHPSFFRRHVFKWMETSKATNIPGLARVYGYPGRNAIISQYGSMLKFFLDNGIATKDTYYIDVVSASQAKDLKDLMQTVGIII